MNEQAHEQLTAEQEHMLEVFGAHMHAELVSQNVDDALDTMADDPHVNHVPVMTGGTGRRAVRRFYSRHLIGRFLPPDTETFPVSRTVGSDQIVEESVAHFTHSMELDWMLPGVAPTGKRVEVAVVVIIRFRDGKIAHEHIYWDQASVLVQLGLLDPRGLPVAGAECARKLLDPSLPSNQLIERY